MGSAVNEEAAGLLIVVWLPLVVLWAVVMVDLIRRIDLGWPGKVSWAVLCTLLWPVLIAYLLMRPPRGRLEAAQKPADRRGQLVAAALDHESGRITSDQMATVARELRSA